MDRIFQDLRYGLRLLLKSPGVSATAILTLALGIGVNVAVFSFVDAIWLRSLPVPDASRIVKLYTSQPSSTGEVRAGATSYPDLLDLRAHSTTLGELVAAERRGGFLEQDGITHQLLIEVVSENYFSLFAVRPAVGRLVGEAELKAGSAPVAVLGYRFWQQHYRGDRSVAGALLVLRGSQYTIVGVLPPQFRGTEPLLDPDLFVPLGSWHQNAPGEAARITDRRRRDFEVYGRLRPGFTMDQSRTELAILDRALAEEYPESNAGRKFSVVLESQSHGSSLAVLGSIFLAIAALVLLIACANVINLLLARGEYRRNEITMRLVLGAGRTRLLQQMLTESALLAAVAAVVAVVFGYALISALPALVPLAGRPITIGAQLDGRAFLIAIVTAIATVFLCGLAPALQALKQPGPGLKDSGYHISTPQGAVRNALIVAQLAISLVLAIASGLLLRSVFAAQASHPGFDARASLLLVDVFPQYRLARLRSYFRDVQGEMNGLPGVMHFAVAGRLPLSGHGDGATRRIVVAGAVGGAAGVPVNYTSVSPGYFAAMGTLLLRGRDFNAGDVFEAPHVAIVNRSMAARFWPGGDPIGQHFAVTGAGGYDCTVVGLVEDGKYSSIAEDPRPYMFMAWEQEPWGGATLVFATANDPANLASAVRDRLRAIDRNVVLARFVTMREHMHDAIYEQRLAAQLSAALAGLGILLSAIGLYGVISYLVGRRRREIAIRMALGASPKAVLSLFLSRGMWLAVLGIALGSLGAFAASRFIASLLFGVTARDPLTFAGAALGLLLVVAVATYLPARRATQIEPLEALRSE
jgi:predicted permease